ncbi:MAG: hydroxymethylbilane synthase [Alphaproteobacteria bacterium GM202ARS2]|nr:hydroxymethylbilane synthase [Alphaproteobacteria bacterium GM202ARS2]
MLRIASRSSRLAQAQTALFAKALWHHHPQLKATSHITTITSPTPPPTSRATLSRKDIFTRALDRALLARRIDCAVHSLKDLPAQLADGLVIACFLPRTEARDALVMATRARDKIKIKNLKELPPDTTLATSSLRRCAFIRMTAPSIRLVPMRGDIDTRLDKLHSTPTIDGLILAAAGLQRIGQEHAITLLLPPEVMLPAPGQGTLAVVCRQDDTRCLDTLMPLNDPNSRLCALAERATVRALGADCHAPVAAYATIDATTLTLQATLADPDGKRSWTMTGAADKEQAEELGCHIGTNLREQAGRDFCQKYLTPPTPPRPPAPPRPVKS